eukprot:TRINITY_DN2070_c0_g1_i1.p1 TRINITY_DN2070_c0_g1~~TRINITY_DN2070_c0_g1_i1.p1  ORF type:complete len:429 (-),score=157.55 TRINITY_DN2070_c0_g1_i1:190-1332(-)
MELKSVVDHLGKRFPLRLAEKWDNVGLLVEPTVFKSGKKVDNVLITIDLTEKVLEEALSLKSNFILSYHPPIFSALKRLTTQEVKERIVIRAIENGIAIYSPHTSVDSSPDGVNDWLASGLGEASKVEVVQPYSYQDPNQALKVVVFVPKESVEKVREALCKVEGVAHIGNYSHCTFSTPGTGSFLGNESSNPVVGQKGKLETVEEVRLEMVCSHKALPQATKAIKENHPYETPAWEVFSLQSLPVEGTGQGRLVTLKEPVKLTEMVQRIKKHLGLPHVRLATSELVANSEEATVKTIALCAGSGFEVVGKLKVDLLLTGEMRHHDVLAAISKGTSVVLCEHTNTERGYLTHLQKELAEKFGSQVAVHLSKQDADPLVVV